MTKLCEMYEIQRTFMGNGVTRYPSESTSGDDCEGEADAKKKTQLR